MLMSTTQQKKIVGARNQVFSYFAAPTAHREVQMEIFTTDPYKHKAYPVLCAWATLTDCITVQSQLSCRSLTAILFGVSLAGLQPNQRLAGLVDLGKFPVNIIRGNLVTDAVLLDINWQHEF